MSIRANAVEQIVALLTVRQSTSLFTLLRQSARPHCWVWLLGCCWFIGLAASAEAAVWEVVPDPAPEGSWGKPAENLRLDVGRAGEFIYAATPSPFVATSGGNGSEGVAVWNLQTGKRSAELPFKVELDAADKAALSPDGRYLASKNRVAGLSVDVWSFEAKTMQARFTLSTSYVPLKFIGFVNSKQLVTCPGSKGKQSITVWDLEAKQPLHDIDFGQELDGGAIALSPGGRYLAGVQLHKNVLVVIDLLKGKLVEQIVWDNVPGSGFWNSFQGLAFSPDGEELAGIYSAGSLRIRVWRMTDGKQILDEPLSIPAHPNLVGYPSYKGRVIEWLPDKSGWVCHGQFVIAREQCRQVMQLRAPKGVLVLPPIRVFPDNQLVFATGQQTNITMLAKPLRFVPPVAAEGQPVAEPWVGPGVSVALNLDVGETRHAEAGAVREQLQSAITRRLESDHLTVSDKSSVSFHVKYSEHEGKTLERSSTVIPPRSIFGRIDPNAPATGSGFVISSEGHLVTCAHVVGKLKSVTVKIGDAKHKATVLATSEKLDLALLKVDAKDLTPLRLFDSDKVELGEEVRAFGFPLSDMLGSSLKATRGTVAGIVKRDGQNLFQIDASINPGNSGGPLLNEQAAVVGICSAKLVGRAVENVGFAVPSRALREFLLEQKLELPEAPAAEKLDGPALVKRATQSLVFVSTHDIPDSPDPVTVKSTTIKYRLSWRQGDQTLWEHEAEFSPRVISARGGLTDVSARTAAFDAFVKSLAQEPIPYYISRDKTPVILPGIFDLVP